jgi:membrane protease subunit (stomatin/prohibitin family)
MGTNYRKCAPHFTHLPLLFAICLYSQLQVSEGLKMLALGDKAWLSHSIGSHSGGGGGSSKSSRSRKRTPTRQEQQQQLLQQQQQQQQQHPHPLLTVSEEATTTGATAAAAVTGAGNAEKVADMAAP